MSLLIQLFQANNWGVISQACNPLASVSRKSGIFTRSSLPPSLLCRVRSRLLIIPRRAHQIKRGISQARFRIVVCYSNDTKTLPSAKLRQRAKKKVVSSDPTPSTSLLGENDVLHYYSSGETRECDTLTDLEEFSGDAADAYLKPPSFRDMMEPRVLIALTSHGFLTFCDMSIQVLLPLMWSTSVEHGGLGFTPSTIGLTMGIYGVVNAFIQFKFLGKIIRRFGPRRVFIVAFSTFLVSLSCFPLEGYFSRQAGGADWRVWIAIVVQLTVDCMRYGAYGESPYGFMSMRVKLVSLCVGAIQIVITDSAPQSLGMVNGMGQAVGCVMRSLAPSAASSLYAISLQRNWARGNAVYYALMVVVACGIRFSLMLPRTLQIMQ